MDRTRRGCTLAVVAVLALAGIAPASAGAGGVVDESGSVAAVAATDGTNITVTQRVALTPDRPGEVEVTVALTIPDRVQEVGMRLPPAASVTGTDGFAPDSGDRYDWTGDTDQPTITYTLPVNETVSGTGPEPGSGRYLFVDAGQWALVQPPKPGLRWQWEGDRVRVERSLAVAGPGAAGDAIAYLGSATVHERTANGQTVRLVVPDRASLRPEPAAVLEAMTAASAELRVGDRDRQVLAVAAPMDVDWGVRGLQTGDSDMWIRATEPLDVADNTWLHEYVHARQQLNTTGSTRWFVEASATYYAALLALETDLVGFGGFEHQLRRGTLSQYDDVVLADPATWTYRAEYDKGALVAGVLDRRIRLATDRGRSLEAVFRWLNDRAGPVDHEAFRDRIAAVGNQSTAATADHFLTTSATPETWTRREHNAAFGAAPARVTTAAPGPNPFRIEGTFRNTSVTALPTLVAGETLRVPVTVSNVGGQRGTYDVALSVNGTAVARATGELGAGNTTTITLTTAFPDVGTYRLTAGEAVWNVTVVEPATPSIAAITANRTDFVGAGPVTVTAQVRNDEPVPARGPVTFSRGGDEITTRTVTLAPGASKTVTATVDLPDPGRYILGVNGRSIVVTANPEPTPTATATATTTTTTAQTSTVRTTTRERRGPGTTTTSGPGFTAWMTVPAGVLLLLAGRRSLAERE